MIVTWILLPDTARPDNYKLIFLVFCVHIIHTVTLCCYVQPNLQKRKSQGEAEKKPFKHFTIDKVLGKEN